MDDDGESVELSFGTLPDRVTVGSTAASAITITDDDTAGVTVSESALTIEEGGDATYTVRLDTQPTDSVTVTVNDPANTDVTAEPASLTFSASTWSTAQTVTVSAKQDDDAIDEEQATISHTVTSTDSAYSGVAADSVTVSITDDDEARVFDAGASYRILTQYGSTTEIVLSDHLAEGVTGIRFTLKSCESSRGDYYDSATVENGKLILTSNTLGHIHGKNTRGETVCTVTGSGENGSADQEFRLYTVSDRTPPPLLAGDLSLVEARPGELDIRVSVPEGSLNYVRLAWGKAGDQPTFRVVEGVSDETVLTIPGLEAGTEYDVRAYLMTFQSFDLYRVGNAGPPVGLIPEGRPDNKWIRNLSSAGLGKSQTITVRTAYGLSLSIDDVKESENAGSMTFEVTLSETSNEVVTVDWATSDGTAEAPGDYEATTAGRLTFAPGETTQTFQVTIEDDAVDEAEEETFTVTLSNAVNADLSDASATGTITDDDAPAVTVSFEQGAYSVAEGSGVTVKVQLSADPERTVTIPLSADRPGRGQRLGLLRGARQRGVRERGDGEELHLHGRRRRGGRRRGERRAVLRDPAGQGDGWEHGHQRRLHHRRRHRRGDRLRVCPDHRRGRRRHLHGEAGHPAHGQRDGHRQRPGQHRRDGGAGEPHLQRVHLEHGADGHGVGQAGRRRHRRRAGHDNPHGERSRLRVGERL